MRKFLALLLASAFFLTVTMAYAGDNQAVSDESGEELGQAFLTSVLIGAVAVGLIAWGITTTIRSSKRNETAAIFNEASSCRGERPNVEILAKMYDLSVENVIDTISMLVAGGEIDIEMALKDEEYAQKSLLCLTGELEQQMKERYGSTMNRWERIHNRVKEDFPHLYKKINQIGQGEKVRSVELANLYRDIFTITGE